jgi:predicted outer membrane repeat protein
MPHRPGHALALGLRAGSAGVFLVAQAASCKEPPMPLFSWLHKRMMNRTPIRPTSVRRVPSRFRPQFEILEARDVPSTLTVTTSQDGVAGSLRAEILAAHPGDTIVISSTVTQTIQLTAEELVIDKNLTIQGGGHVIQGVGVRVFEVDGATTIFNLSGVVIFGGDGFAYGTAPAENDGKGGAILNFGTTTLSGCTLFNNSAGQGGAIYNFGTMTLSGCSVEVNSATGGGGGIYNAGTLAIDYSYVLNNTALGGADIFNIGTLTKDHSKIGHVAT